MKKAPGNDKLANKRQHLGENKTISKWQGVFQVEPRWHRAKHQGAQESEHRQRAGTKSGEGGSAEPSVAGAKEGGQRGRRQAREVPRKTQC